MKNILGLFLTVSIICRAGAQDDSLYRLPDSIAYLQPGSDTGEYYTGAHYEETVYRAPPDSTPVQKRAFEQHILRKLKADPELNYREPPTIGESIWSRIWSWLADQLDSFFGTAVGTGLGRFTLYALGLGLLIVLILMILKVNAFKVLYFGRGIQKYQVLDEDIHEMDFERLIQQSIESQDYRRGIRLLFLYALKLLSDRQLIQWESGKTNHEYLRELGRADLRTGLHDLSYYFDYAWYGNFSISRTMFHKVQDTFRTWKEKLD